MKETFKEFWNRKKKDQKRTVKTKDIGRNATVHFEVQSITKMQQANNPEKYFVIERIKRKKVKGELAHPEYVKEEGVEYRIGYYIVGKNGRMKGRWTWGQFTPMIPVEDFWNLINKAKKEGTILESEDLES